MGDYDEPFVPQPPTLGEQVNYVARGSLDGVYKPVNRVAFITATTEEEPARLSSEWHVELYVINPDGQFFNHNVAYDENKSPGTWHYPWWDPAYGTANEEPRASRSGTAGRTTE